MSDGSSKLTVFFDDPFWVGLYESEVGGRYRVCRVVFGAEPKDQEVYQYFLNHWRDLRFSPSIASAKTEDRRRNPKRLQREAHQAVLQTGMGTKAQQAMKLQQEEHKLARQTRSREQREAEAERQFALRQEKRKEKHRGH